MPSVAFFIDGFNVYYSIDDAINAGSIKNGKWLDYYSLCETFRRDVPWLGTAFTLESVNYYSALATHLADHTKSARHRVLVRALMQRGVSVQLGTFRYKGKKKCYNCGDQWDTHEEKETDINLALGLFKCFAQNRADVAVILSADTDMVSVVREARNFFPGKKVGIGFPYGKNSNHLRTAADFAFTIRADQYETHQFPSTIVLPGGQRITKPTSW